MGKSHGKLVIDLDGKSNPRSRRRVDKGNADLDIPHIDDVTERQSTQLTRQLSDGNIPSTSEGCNGKPDQPGGVERSQSGKKEKKNMRRWLSKNQSKKNENRKSNVSDAKEVADSVEEGKGEVDKTEGNGDVRPDTSLVEEVMTSAVVTQAEETVASADTPASSQVGPNCLPETAVTDKDISEGSKLSELEQPPVESAVQPTEQGSPEKTKHRVEIVRIMPSTSVVTHSSDEDENHADKLKSDVPLEDEKEEEGKNKPAATDENYLPVDTNNTNVYDEEMVNEEKEKTVTLVYEEQVDQVPEDKSNGVHEDKPDGVHEDKPDRVHEDKFDGVPEDKSNGVHEDKPDRVHEDKPDGVHGDTSDGVHEDKPDGVHGDTSDRVHEDKPDRVHEDKPDGVHEDKFDGVPEDKSNGVHEDKPDRVHEDKPDGVHEDTSDGIHEIVNVAHKKSITDKLTDKDLTNGSAHEATLPSPNPEQECIRESVI